MKRLLLAVLIALLLFPAILSGQIATRQAGLRFGYTSGIFYQVSSDQGNAEIAYNGMLSFRKNGVQFTGLKIIYTTSIGDISPDLYFGWGYGGHIGFVYADHLKFMGDNYYFRGDRFCPLVGVDGWLGAEYRVHDIPLNISLNIKPFIEITMPSFVRVMPGDVALSVSYIF